MFTDPYKTTPCQDYSLSRIEQAIKTARVDGTIANATSGDGRQVNGVKLVTTRNAEVPSFAHPLQLLSDDQKGDYYVDVRGCTSIDRNGNLNITSRTEYDLILLRAMLNKHWRDNSPMDFIALGPLPLTVFCRWISENITRRFGLDPLAQLTVSVVAGYFFLSMYQEDAELSSETVVKLGGQISRATSIPTETVLEIGDRLKEMKDVSSFVDNLVAAVDSVRLEKFSVGLLYASLGGSWYGLSGNEIAAVALEHPPTFAALVYTGLRERGYRNAGLSKIILACDKGDVGKNFAYHLLSLTSIAKN